MAIKKLQFLLLFLIFRQYNNKVTKERRAEKKRKLKTVTNFEIAVFAVSLLMFLLAKIGGPLEGLNPLAAFLFMIGFLGFLLLVGLFIDDGDSRNKSKPKDAPVQQVTTTVVDQSINLGLINNRGAAVPLPTPKNKWVAFFLCLFFGCFGVHKFYEGKILLGILYIFTFGFLCFGVFIDLIIILSRPREYYPK